MLFILYAIIGFLIGAVLTWVIASNRVSRKFSEKISDVEHRASAFETRVSSLEGINNELRAQNQKNFEDLSRIRDQLTKESSA